MYEAIIFDYGGTLGFLDKSKFLNVPHELHGLIPSLYHRGYRLAVISNTQQHSDSLWLRTKLQSYDLLRYFELILGVYKDEEVKPNPATFRRVTDFMQVDPKKCLMVGDSERCDGGAREIGMDYLQVCVDNGIWIGDLERKLRSAIGGSGNPYPLHG